MTVVALSDAAEMMALPVAATKSHHSLSCAAYS